MSRMAPSTQHDGDGPPPKRRRTECVAATPARQHELGIMRQDRDRGASFVGSASGIHFVRSVYNAVETSSPGDEASLRHEIVPGEEDQLPRDGRDRTTDRLWGSGETHEADEGNKVSFDELVQLSQSYFDHWHPILPFLHAPSFLDWCEIVSEKPLNGLASLSPHRAVIVQAVMSTSLADRRQAGLPTLAKPVPSSLVFQSFHQAVKSVETSLISAPSTESLQAALSVQLFLISMLRHNAASRIGGIIIRLLFQMGMHRCPHRYSGFSRSECVLRQRVFWSAYCLDRYICQSLGIPLTLRDDDIDVCLLDHEQHPRSDGKRHGECFVGAGVDYALTAEI